MKVGFVLFSFICLFAVILVLGCHLFFACFWGVYPHVWHHIKNKDNSGEASSRMRKKNTKLYTSTFSVCGVITQILQDKIELKQITIPTVIDSASLLALVCNGTMLQPWCFSKGGLQSRHIVSLLFSQTESTVQVIKGHSIREEKVVCVLVLPVIQIDW